MDKTLEDEYGDRVIKIFRVVTRVSTVSGEYVAEEYFGRVYPSIRGFGDIRGGSVSAEELLQRLKASIDTGQI